MGVVKDERFAGAAITRQTKAVVMLITLDIILFSPKRLHLVTDVS